MRGAARGVAHLISMQRVASPDYRNGRAVTCEGNQILETPSVRTATQARSSVRTLRTFGSWLLLSKLFEQIQVAFAYRPKTEKLWNVVRVPESF